MLTKPVALRLWQKIASCSAEWIMSAEGKRLCEDAVNLVRQVEGKEEADILRDLITCASIY